MDREYLTVVGIGASAGGVKAIQKFMEEIPPNLGVAFVVVVHLSPNIASELAPILSLRTKMPVTQVHGTISLEPNHVYVIPPDRRLKIAGDEISAVEFKEKRGLRAPIDLFFRSLAEHHGDGFAIVLTGAGSDGAGGVSAVKEAGGIILVQDPAEAEYPSMPRSAIATGAADLVLPLDEIVSRLPELIRRKHEIESATVKGNENESLSRILAYVRDRTDHDFSKYKRSTILRRITRRQTVAGKASFSEYFAYLRENAEEIQGLFGDLLISVTSFFRDPKSYEKLSGLVIPRLFETADAAHGIRVWVPGCATGEEAYSIAILLLEEATRIGSHAKIQIFASDLDDGALAAGRIGRYPIAIEADVGEERLRRFFERDGDHYQVKRELRDLVLFARHSILRDPPFSRLSLISCRNLLIYLDRDLQRQAIAIFHYALRPGGFLFLGSSENADHPTGLFRTLDREAKLFQATERSTSQLPQLFEPARPLAVAPIARPPAAAGEATLHRQALENVAPPSILVDEAHRILHLSEKAGRYLQPPSGVLSADVAELARAEIRADLRMALLTAFEKGEPTLSLPILVQFNGAPHRVYLQVKPVPSPESSPKRAVVFFIEGEAVLDGPTIEDDRQRTQSNSIQRLKQELLLTHASLKATREASETTHEELRAANEELQSMNEEYRSTAEELETSREELQSVNEELQTVNNELKQKLDSTARAQGDLENFMAATDVGTLFLDRDMRIKRFTSRIKDLFSITDNDLGRPIADFTNQLEYSALISDAAAVLESLSSGENEVRTRPGKWYLMRMRPYRTVEDKIDGVVITFVDVSHRKRDEEALIRSQQELQQETRLVELSRAPIFVWNFDGGIVKWNRGSESLYGYSREEAIGKKKEELLATTVPGSSFAALRKELAANGTWSGELKQKTKDGRKITVETQIELVTSGDAQLCLESVRDITDRKAWEERQTLLLSELSHRVKNTLSVVLAISGQTLRGSKNCEDFVRSFEGRVMALANAHQQLAQSDWQGAELDTLVREQLHPFGDVDRKRIIIKGDSILLPPSLATPFAMVINELSVNAMKYGALSSSKGKVSLCWRLFDAANGEKILSFIWKETGGPRVQEPKMPGYGSQLIDHSLPGAKVKREFNAKGFICTIELPLAKDEWPELG